MILPTSSRPICARTRHVGRGPVPSEAPTAVSNTNGSTHRSGCIRPSTDPATMVISSPAVTYRSAIRQPNMPNSRTTATSFTSGLAIRKESVTPSGTPAATKPMNAGTALHEQKGVATPSAAAATFARPSRRPPSRARVRSIVTNERRIVTTKMIPLSSSRIFVVS